MSARTKALTAAGLALLMSQPAFAAGNSNLFDAFAPLFGQQQDERAPSVQVAQTQQEAQLMLRLQQLEEQLRDLTGQIEGMQFTITQQQTILQRLTDQISAMQGGQPAAAAPAPTSAVPANAEPGAGQVAAVAPTSQDPLVGTGQGAQPAELGTVPEGSITTLPAPLELDPTAAAPDPDADAQFTAANTAYDGGDFGFAEQQAQQFIELYPEDPRAADAVLLIGKSKLQQGAYAEAAEVLFDGFQAHQESPRAASMLLNLGIALSGAGERDTACRTFTEVKNRYGAQSADIAQQVAEQAARAQCPPIG